MARSDYEPIPNNHLKLVKTKNIIKQANLDNLPIKFHLATVKVNASNMGCSGFVENTNNGKIVYINTDCMPFTGQPYKVLYRTASHLKDWRGGSNNYATPDELGKCVLRMLA